MRVLIAFCLILTCLPAQAILDEDYLMIKTYFAHEDKWPNKKAVMKSFAALRLKARPDIFQCYTDQEQKIIREYWATGAVPWNLKMAHEIRDSIMGGRRPQAGYPTSAGGLLYVYADGSRVTYHISHGGVFSILANNKDYDPGDFGWIPAMPSSAPPANTPARIKAPTP